MCHMQVIAMCREGGYLECVRQRRMLAILIVGGRSQKVSFGPQQETKANMWEGADICAWAFYYETTVYVHVHVPPLRRACFFFFL